LTIVFQTICCHLDGYEHPYSQMMQNSQAKGLASGGSGIAQGWNQREMLRFFDSRGSQGFPIGVFTGSNSGSETVQSYFTPLIIPAAIGVAIAIIACVVACIIACARCCCNCCCKGDPDPERKFLAMRIIVGALCCLVVAASFLGLAGGVLVTEGLRDGVDDLIDAVFQLKTSLQRLIDSASEIGFESDDLQAIVDTIDDMENTLRGASSLMTPFDCARLVLVYIAMSLGMLAGLTLGFGVLSRRKQIVITGFIVCLIAIFIAWLSFAINYPTAVLLDAVVFEANDCLPNAAFEAPVVFA